MHCVIVDMIEQTRNTDRNRTFQRKLSPRASTFRTSTEDAIPTASWATAHRREKTQRAIDEKAPRLAVLKRPSRGDKRIRAVEAGRTSDRRSKSANARNSRKKWVNSPRAGCVMPNQSSEAHSSRRSRKASTRSPNLARDLAMIPANGFLEKISPVIGRGNSLLER
jgi:hypothetical protein